MRTYKVWFFHPDIPRSYDVVRANSATEAEAIVAGRYGLATNIRAVWVDQ